ncbi:hypothetical protein AURDEDRAFT_172693 [Auricularia subglabra TFB-10046 SS5]|nr:hypothetical protein AURDEDRAFT_172693 [Auricularia subglabra TFB-10046 SS5]
MGMPHALHVLFPNTAAIQCSDLCYSTRSRKDTGPEAENSRRLPPSASPRLPVSAQHWQVPRQPTLCGAPQPRIRVAYTVPDSQHRPSPSPSAALQTLLQRSPALLAVLRERAVRAALQLIKLSLSGHDSCRVPPARIHALLSNISALLAPASPTAPPARRPRDPSEAIFVHAVRRPGHGLDGAQASLLLPGGDAQKCPLPECEEPCAEYEHLRGPARCLFCGGGAWSQSELLGHLALHLARFL